MGLGGWGIGLWVWGDSLGFCEGLSGEDSLGVLEGVEVGEVRLELRRRLDGEKVTVAEIFGGGVGGFGSNGDCDGEEVEGEGDGIWGLGAKKREITCCFCFPMESWGWRWWWGWWYALILLGGSVVL